MNRTSAAVVFEQSDQPDGDIIQGVLDGNTALFELLMRRYNERLYRASRAIVRDDQEAEDVMQQTRAARSSGSPSIGIRPSYNPEGATTRPTIPPVFPLSSRRVVGDSFNLKSRRCRLKAPGRRETRIRPKRRRCDGSVVALPPARAQ